MPLSWFKSHSDFLSLVKTPTKLQCYNQMENEYAGAHLAIWPLKQTIFTSAPSGFFLRLGTPLACTNFVSVQLPITFNTKPIILILPISRKTHSEANRFKSLRWPALAITLFNLDIYNRSIPSLERQELKRHNLRHSNNKFRYPFQKHSTIQSILNTIDRKDTIYD